MAGLSTFPTSGNGKTGNIAQTYRAGDASPYGGCPRTCALMPTCHRDKAATAVDRRYLRALLAAVPINGIAWTYTHFTPAAWVQAFRARLAKGLPTTTINASADTTRQAADWAKRGIPAVYTVPANIAPRKSWREHGALFVRCPAEYAPVRGKSARQNDGKVQCSDCGGGRPLCARPDRGYVVAFHAHGIAKGRVGSDTGGCYAGTGRAFPVWSRVPTVKDCATKLREFVATLRPGSMLRHHVAGDIGRDV